jgi:hypothetical protein
VDAHAPVIAQWRSGLSIIHHGLIPNVPVESGGLGETVRPSDLSAASTLDIELDAPGKWKMIGIVARLVLTSVPLSRPPTDGLSISARKIVVHIGDAASQFGSWEA